MNDILTEQIMKQLQKLSVARKKAILELLKKNDSSSDNPDKQSLKQWQNELLTTSVWTDSEIEEIYKAGEYINKWMTNRFF